MVGVFGRRVLFGHGARSSRCEPEEERPFPGQALRSDQRKLFEKWGTITGTLRQFAAVLASAPSAAKRLACCGALNSQPSRIHNERKHSPARDRPSRKSA